MYVTDPATDFSAAGFISSPLMAEVVRLFQIVLVIPLVGPHFAMVNLQYPIHQVAQEVTVVADQYDRAGEVLQRIQQHLP